MIGLLNISKKYDNNIIYQNFNLSLKPNSVNVILGPSGCGKSTLLDIISGLTEPDGGELYGVSSNEISYLFQEPRLLPWKSVLDNITYVLQGDKKVAKDKSLDILQKIGLSDSLNLLPDEISGGMARRVAIARAFAFKSKLLILDEPFASLDSDLKRSLIKLFKELWRDDKRTVLCVTHDTDAAELLADRLIKLTDKPVQIEGIINYD